MIPKTSFPLIRQNQKNSLQDENIPKPYRDVAKGMETQFLNMMLGEMRKTINKEDPDSSAMDYYNSMMDYERSNIMAEKDGGVGIQKLILDEIYPKRMRGKLQSNPHQSIEAYNKVTSEPLKEGK